MMVEVMGGSLFLSGQMAALSGELSRSPYFLKRRGESTKREGRKGRVCERKISSIKAGWLQFCVSAGSGITGSQMEPGDVTVPGDGGRLLEYLTCNQMFRTMY